LAYALLLLSERKVKDSFDSLMNSTKTEKGGKK
jgi:hypothetical protein